MVLHVAPELQRVGKICLASSGGGGGGTNSTPIDTGSHPPKMEGGGTVQIANDSHVFCLPLHHRPQIELEFGNWNGMDWIGSSVSACDS